MDPASPSHFGGDSSPNSDGGGKGSFSVFDYADTLKFDFDLTAICEPCCENINVLLTDPALRKDSHRHAHHHTRAALLASARGCIICHLISREFNYTDYESYNLETTSRYSRRVNIHSSPSVMYWSALNLVQVNWPKNANPTDKTRGKILLKGASQGLLPDVQFAVPVPESYPATRENINRVKAWMDDCRNQHPVCARTRTTGTLPRRVLDISDIAQGFVVLHESSLGEKAPYIAISYCWGTGAALKTTRANLQSHFKAIALAAFPETLRDVIRLAWGLSFRYVWIDALCIIQGDESDWAEQAKNMTGIYHGCTLNIAAADAPDSNAGVVRRLGDWGVRVGTVSKLFRHHWQMGDCDIYAMCTSNKPRGALPSTHSRLATRGWIFQETLVSVATVFFTHGGLVWECCTKTWLEGQRLSESDSTEATIKRTWARGSNNWSTQGRVAGTPQPVQGLDAEKNIKHLRTLYSWVSEVSKRRLTEPRDKLPCVAGLVSRLANRTSASYMAGLWKEDLIVGLTWRVRIYPRSKRHHPPSAPSWSWASVDGEVVYPEWFIPGYDHQGSRRPMNGLDLQIVNTIVEEVYPGSFGEVKVGRLTVRGVTWTGTISGRQYPKLDHPFEPEVALIDMFTVDESRDWGKGSPCIILRIMHVHVSGSVSFRAGPYSFYLVAERCGSSTDEYRRVGFLALNKIRVGEKSDPPGEWKELVLV